MLSQYVNTPERGTAYDLTDFMEVGECKELQSFSGRSSLSQQLSLSYAVHLVRVRSLRPQVLVQAFIHFAQPR